jgi:two-component system sensor histidine kinase/response regulator
MAQELPEERAVFLGTMPAGPNERRLAWILLLISVIGFIALAPFAKTPLAKVWAFIPAYQSALVVNDLITAVLLFGQYGILRSRALLLLASAYLFTGFMAIVHAMTFPDLFAPGGLLGAGPQTTAWLYMFWHGGFPLLIAAYALYKEPSHPPRGKPYVAILWCVVSTAVAVGIFALIATAGKDLLPPIMQDNHYTSAMISVVSCVWVLSLLALALLWKRHSRTVLDLWLMVVMCAWLFDVALSAVVNAGRFDLGFYTGRIYGLVAASFVLLMLLLENAKLYAELVRTSEHQRQQTRELRILNKELESFGYSVSHDLRAPLRAINGYAEIIRTDYYDMLDANGRHMLERMATNSERMGQLIDDLLAFSRLGRQPIKTQQIKLDDLVDETIKELKVDVGERHIDFTVGELGTAKADPTLLKQALVNLLGNSVKFTRKQSNAVVEVGCTETDDEKVYFIKDNGAGFDMRYAEKLFGVFQRLHSVDEFEGTGVGLAIVQRVIHRHGGRVWADSTPGHGAAFYFTLESSR